MVRMSTLTLLPFFWLFSLLCLLVLFFHEVSSGLLLPSQSIGAPYILALPLPAVFGSPVSSLLTTSLLTATFQTLLCLNPSTASPLLKINCALNPQWSITHVSAVPRAVHPPVSSPRPCHSPYGSWFYNRRNLAPFAVLIWFALYRLPAHRVFCLFYCLLQPSVVQPSQYTRDYITSVML